VNDHVDRTMQKNKNGRKTSWKHLKQKEKSQIKTKKLRKWVRDVLQEAGKPLPISVFSSSFSSISLPCVV